MNKLSCCPFNGTPSYFFFFLAAFLVAFLAAFFAAFLTAFFIDSFSLTSKICDPERSHRDSYIRWIEVLVKKKMRGGAAEERQKIKKRDLVELFLSDFGIRTRSPAPLITFAVMIAMSLLGCGGKKSRTTKIPRIGEKETGVASWYGDPYHGRRTASGEVYDMEKMTAAHRTMAFHTWVKVENLSNGKSVAVRINDRGPFVRGRIIDLSRSAARSIEMLGPGTAKVRIEVIEKPQSGRVPDDVSSAGDPDEGKFGVQVGAFRDRENASRLAADLHQKFGTVRVVPREGSFTIWRVIVGDLATEIEAAALVSQLSDEGIEGFTVRLDPALPSLR